ncbi:dnaJ homolog subfamily C member 21-like, partial [Musca vetustissima]|uniref:dnaJ homolog subfamily C member 21-like n=1 Tax=Musca vetustissima TaxID=27455 RepID=UPI002AB61D83
CLDVFQYFTVSCFKGYGDDSKGFYAVYREVFEKIAAEDAEFMDDEMEMENIPSFGDSTSSYEEVVGPFYAWWSAYCTKRTYTWLCPYDIKEIKDRRILREIEKDMKKVVQKAKKERNEEVRNLVSFVRKRDKRVQAYKKQLEERAAFNRQKQEQNRLEQIRKRQQELAEMRQNSIAAQGDDYEEQLKQLEQQYSSDEDAYSDEEEDEDDGEYDNDIAGDDVRDDDQDDSYEELYDDLYCVACNRAFKNEKAFANHETSKKHRENVEKLKLEMHEEENLYQGEEDEDDIPVDAEDLPLAKEETEELEIEDNEEEQEVHNKKSKSRKSKNKKDSKKSKLPVLINSDEEIEEDDELSKQAAKLNISKVDDDDHEDDDDWDNKYIN